MIGVWYGTGQGSRLSLDGKGYYEIAQNIIQGHGFQFEGEPTSRRGPVYPLFIAGISKLAPFPLGVQMAQMLIGAMSCVILFLIGREIFGTQVGILAGGIHGVDYLSVRQTTSTMPEVVFVFFLLLSTWLVIRAREENRMGELALAGIFAGVSVLTKEVLTFYFLLLGFWFFLTRHSWKSRALRAAVFFLSFSLTIAPWIIRNRLVYGKWVFITVSAGHSFYMGNSPFVVGRIVGKEWGLDEDGGWFPQDDPNLPPLFTSEADQYLFRRGLEFVGSHPLRFLELAGIRILRFWYPYYYDSPLPTKILTLLCYLPTLISGIVGMGLSSKRWKELLPLWGPILYLLFICAVTISSIRYRYPAMPFLMLFAAFGIRESWKRSRSAFLPFESL